ncbi:unnamed protein product [Brucella canis str. Oliveri]|nr:unnamed protein product [Brucella canis str. Oliveri]
MKQLLDRLD